MKLLGRIANKPLIVGVTLYTLALSGCKGLTDTISSTGVNSADVSGSVTTSDQGTNSTTVSTNISVVEGANKILVRWTPSSSSPQTIYSIKRSVTAGNGYETIATDLPSPSYLDSQVTNDVTYYYLFEARTSQGIVDSAEISAVPRNVSVSISNISPNIHINDTNQSAFSLYGTCSPKTSTVRISGTLISSVSCSDGKWYSNLNLSALRDNDGSASYVFFADLNDAFGKQATQAMVRLYKDTVLPVVAITTPATGAPVNLANVQSFTVNGTCTADSQPVAITITDGSTSASPTSQTICRTDQSPQFSAVVDLSRLANAPLTVTAGQTDLAGNKGADTSVYVTKQVGPASVAITSPPNNSYINIAKNSAQFTVSGICDVNIRAVQLTLNGVNAPGASSGFCSGGKFSFSMDTTGIASGNHILNAKGTDVLGNQSVSLTVNVIKDLAPPVLSFANPTLLTQISTSNQFNFLVSGGCSESGLPVVASTSNSGVTASVTTLCAATVPPSFSTFLNVSSIPNGTVTVSASQADAAGNTGSHSLQIQKSPPPPALAITSPLVGAYINSMQAPSFSVTGSCNTANRPVTIRVDGSAANQTASTCTNGLFSSSINLSNQPDGPHNLAATAQDMYGNIGTSPTVGVVKKAILPSVGFAVPTILNYVTASNVSAFTAYGNCSENGRTVSVQAYQGASTVNPTSGNYICNILTFPNWSAVFRLNNFTDGTVSFKVSQDDIFGNTGSTSVSVAKKTNVPTVSVTTPTMNTVINNGNSTSQFTVSGTCSETSQNVTIKVDGNLLGSGTCNGSTYTSKIDVTSLSEGLHSLVANITDVAGNSSVSSAVAFTVSTDASTLVVSGYPTLQTAGESGGITVTARDASGITAVNYRGTISFLTSDTKAVKPSNYTFTAEDQGTHLFPTSYVLKTSGTHSISSVDVLKPTLFGIHSSVTVVPAAAQSQKSTLTASPSVDLFASGTSASTLSIQLKDSFGNAVTGVTPVLNVTGTNNILTPASIPVTNSTGSTSVQLTTTTAETKTITFSSPTGLTNSATVSFIPANADPSRSTVTIYPKSIASDGFTAATITVIFNGSTGRAVPPVPVTVTSNRGSPPDSITSVQGTTDSTGKAIFIVRSTSIGFVNFTITGASASLTTFAQFLAVSPNSDYQSRLATGTSPGTNGPPAVSLWKNLTALPNADGTLNGFPFTSTNGWSTSTPYPLVFSPSTSDYVNFGTGLNSSTLFSFETVASLSSIGTRGAVLLSNGDHLGRGLTLRQSKDGQGKLELYQGFNNTYADTVLADSPSAYYRLGENGGSTAIDISGNNLNAVYQSFKSGSQVLMTQGNTGALANDSGKSVQFAGDSTGTSGIQMPSNLILNGSDAITIEAWFKTATAGAHGGIIGYDDGTPTGAHLPALYVDTSGFLRAALNYGSSLATITGPAVSDGNWHHVVLAGDNSPQATLFVDGVQRGTKIPPLGALSGIMNGMSLNQNHIGYVAGSGWTNTTGNWFGFNGRIDEVAIYYSALSQTQVTRHYNARNLASCLSQNILTQNQYLLAGVYSAPNKLSLYINGAQECSVTTSTAYAGSSNPMIIGGAYDGTNLSNAFSGSISDFRTYSTGLTGTQAVNNFNGTSSNYSFAPSIVVTTPATSSLISNSNDSTSFTVNGTCNSSTSSTIQIRVDGSAATGAGGSPGAVCLGSTFSTTINTTVIPEGFHSLTAILTAGSTSITSAPVSIQKLSTAVAGQTTLTISPAPAILAANGTSTATLTVTVRNNVGFIIGKKVTLLSNRGEIDTIGQSPGTTNDSGQVSFTVKSTSSGISTLTANVDSLVLTTHAEFLASDLFGSVLANYEARLFDGTNPGNNSSGVKNQWVNLTNPGTHDGSLFGFHYTSSNGWSGAGTVSSPYHLAFLSSTSDYVSLGTGLNSNTDFSFEATVMPSSPTTRGSVILSNANTNGKGIILRQSVDGRSRVVLTLGAQSYDSTVLADSPSAYFRLGEASGATASDSSGTGTNGTFGSGIVLSQQGALINDTDSAVSLNGSTSYVTLTSSLLANKNTLSVEAWFKTTASGILVGSSNQPLGTIPTAYDNFLYVDTQGYLRGQIGTGGASMKSPVPVNNGVWHHAVLTASSSIQKLYLDGIFVSSLNASSTQSSQTSIQMGRNYSQNWVNTNNSFFQFIGQIDEVAFYPTSLTATQVANHYNAKSLASCNSKNALVANSWTSLGGVFNSSANTLSLYVNGNQECSVTLPSGGFTGSTSPLAVGAAFNGSTASSFFSGAISQLRIYGIALSPSQFLTHYLGFQTNYNFVPTVTSNQTQSSISVFPYSIKADGTSTGTITIQLKDQFGVSLPSRSVTLSSSRGSSLETLSTINHITDTAGRAIFTIRSSNVGRTSLLAIADGISLTTYANFLSGSSNRLIAEYDARWFDGFHPGNNFSTVKRSWQNLVPPGNHSAKLNTPGFTLMDGVTDGWGGDGSANNPYALIWSASQFDFATFGTGLNSNSDFSFEMTVNPYSTATRGSVIFANGDSNGQGFTLRQAKDTSGRVELLLGNSSTYADAVLADSPRAYYRLGETNGVSILDSSGNGNIGTPVSLLDVIQGMPGALPNDSDKSIHFSGTASNSGNINLPASLLSLTPSMTVEAWFKTTTTGGIIGMDNTSLTQRTPVFYVDSSGKLRGRIYSSAGGTTTLTSLNGVNDGNWHYAVLSASGSNQSLFVDAVFQTSNTSLGTLTPLQMTRNYIGTAYAGSWPGGGSTWLPFNGQIDEVAVYNTALTQSQVSSHFGARKNASCLSSSQLTNNNYYFIAGVYKSNPTALSLMINGNPQCSVTTSKHLTNSANALAAGASFTGATTGTASNYWSGSISDIRVYSEALSDTSLSNDFLGFAGIGGSIISYAPSVEISSPVHGSVINNTNNSSNFTISGTCDSMSAATITIRVDGSAAAGTGGSLATGPLCQGIAFTTTINTTGISTGYHTLTAVITNAVTSVTSPAISIVKAPTDVVTKLSVSGFPSPQKVGIPGSITVTALNSNGHVFAAYQGTVSFSSTDTAAVLPSNYTFTKSDGGTHTFDQVIFNTKGIHSITATDLGGSPAGTQSNIAILGNLVANWPFTLGTEGLYTFDSTKIQFSTNGIAQLMPVPQTDQDSSATGFGGGSLNGVVFDSSNTYLKLNPTNATNNSELDSTWTPAYDSSLVSYWKLNGSGSIANSAIVSATVGNDATVSNINGTGLTYINSGKLLQAITFDGVDDALTATAPSTVSGQFSVSLWVTPSALSANSFAFGTRGPSSFSFDLSMNLNTIHADIGDGNAWLTTAADATGLTLRANTFYHVVYSVSSTGYTIYLNGTPIKTATLSGTPLLCDSSHNIQIGNAGSNLNTRHQGLIDEVSLWNTALTAAQVQAIYQRQAPQFAGTFVSRIIDVGAAAANNALWTHLTWSSTQPFSKPLPGSGTSETTSTYSGLTNNTLTNGLVGLWRMDETSGGTIADSSGLNNTGTLVGTVGLNNTGKLNKSLSFNGSSWIRVSNPTSIPSGNSPRTIMAWVFDKGTPATTWGGIVSTGQGDCTGRQFGLGKAGNFLSVWGGCYDHNTTTLAIPPYQWTFVAATYDGTTLTAYLNNTPSSTTTRNAFITTTSNVTIGVESIDGGITRRGNSWIGMIDEVAIYNRALSAAEIQQIYQRGASRTQFQVRSCAGSCSDAVDPWLGPDGTNQTYFSESNNTDTYLPTGNILTGIPNLLFSAFASQGLNVGANRYFQYRTILESDHPTDITLGPNVKSVAIGPTHYNASIPTLSNNTGVSFTQLSTITEALGANSCTGGIRYQLSKDNSTWYYLSGNAWTAASSNTDYNQASSGSNIQSQITTFTRQVGKGNLFFRAFFPTNGNNACELDHLSFTGTNFVDSGNSTTGLIASFNPDYATGSKAYANGCPNSDWIWTDLSPNQFTGTLTGFISASCTGTTSGWVGNGIVSSPYALAMNGSTEFVTLPSIPSTVDFSQGLSIEAWIHPTASSSWARIIDFGNGQTADNILFGRSGNSNQIRFEVFHGTSGGPIDSAECLVNNTWQHVAVTLTPASPGATTGTAVIYVNGSNLTTKSGIKIPNNLTRISNYIGKSNWSVDSLYKGKMGQVRVFNRPLTPAEVQQSYYSTSSEYGIGWH